MSFGKWRQQVRLIHGIKLVAEGEKITQAAIEAGYSRKTSLALCESAYFANHQCHRPSAILSSRECIDISIHPWEGGKEVAAHFFESRSARAEFPQKIEQ